MKFMIVLHTLTILLPKRGILACSPEVVIENEMDGYVKEIHLDMRHAGTNIMSNPLLWWKEKEKNYPHIAKLARRILCIPATAAPSERVFSTAGLTISKLRSRMVSDNADMCIFLHDIKVFKDKLANSHTDKLK